jgi:hypothetical protein
MGVGWGVLSWAIIGVNRVEGGKILHVHYLGGLGKCWVGAPHLHERLGRGNKWVVRGLLKWYGELANGAWFA